MKSDCCQGKIHVEQNRYFCTNCLQYCKANINYYRILLYIIIFIICSIISLDLANGKLIKCNTKKVMNTDIILHKDSIFNELVKQDILFPELVIKQVLAESSHLTSKVCKENYNFLGIKYIHQPLAIGELNGHAQFKSYKDCIKDYKRLQQYYLKNIDNKYAENKNYTKLLTQIK